MIGGLPRWAQMKYLLLILPRKPATALVKPLPPGTPSRSNQARALCHRVLLEWGQGKVALKFTTSEEMLPLSSSSQSRVSLCEVYTRMMHFIWSLWKVEERSVCSPCPGGTQRPAGHWAGRVFHTGLMFHLINSRFLSVTTTKREAGRPD